MTWSEELACGVIGGAPDRAEPSPEATAPIAEQAFGPGPLPDLPVLPDLQLPPGQFDPTTFGLPALPPDPVGALLNGIALPALPGVDALMKPMLDLLGSVGTGVLPALDPTAILTQSSQVIETALETALSALHVVDQAWQGRAAHAAQSAGQRAHAEGQETCEHGVDIAGLTNKAAATVAQGNAELTAVAEDFAAQATALAPIILTPPAQGALIASATEHLGQAVTIVTATRAELAGYTTQLGDVVEQLIGTDPGTAADTAQAVAQQVGQPLLSQAQQLLSSNTGHLASLAAAAPPGPIDPAAPTALASLPGLAGAAAPGHGGGFGGLPGELGSAAPDLRSAPGTPPPDAEDAASAVGPGAGSGSPGSPNALGGSQGGRGQRNDDKDHTPTTRQPRDAEAFTAGLENATLGVIGADPSEEMAANYRFGADN